MIEPQEITILMKSVGLVVREYVDAALLTIKAEFARQIATIPAGPKGDPGEAGAPGERGQDGISIKGDPGESIVGPAGKDGTNGIDGKDGQPGIDGQDGLRGFDGAPGKDGRDGREGKDGRDGEPGRDALQLEILPMIDPEKSYPRGTFAKHDGGILRAVRNTAPLTEPLEESGWEVILDGVAAIVVKQEASLREFSIESVLTSGITTTVKCSIPALIYREIYKEGVEYEPGDVVTHGGSAWHCQTPTKASPAASPAAWKLMVKQGREGAIGKDGKPGERGKDGRDGKDLTSVDYSTGKKW